MNYKILAKYIKDLKFEIPDTETYFEFSKEIAKYKINIDIKSKELKKKIIEVETCLHLKPHEKDTGRLKSNIVYNTIIKLDEGVKEKEQIEEIILVKVPSEIYPDLRKIFVLNFESSGFKNIKIEEKVDFKKLYKSKSNQ